MTALYGTEGLRCVYEAGNRASAREHAQRFSGARHTLAAVQLLQQAQVFGIQQVEIAFHGVDCCHYS